MQLGCEPVQVVLESRDPVGVMARMHVPDRLGEHKHHGGVPVIRRWTEQAMGFSPFASRTTNAKQHIGDFGTFGGASD
jgi:hypothetical protein